MPDIDPEENAYKLVLAQIFQARYVQGALQIDFTRAEMVDAAKELGLVIANFGDVLYAARSRNGMPAAIIATQPEGMEWVIEGTGRGRYRFRLTAFASLQPRNDLVTIPVLDATPEIVRAFRLDDEQALLAVIRYNRLVDIFLGIVTYSLQNHLRTHVAEIGQIEIDEIYAGVDSAGAQYLVPVQAKGGRDRLTPMQTRQDLAWCAARWPGVRARAVSAQFMSEDRIALLELMLENDEVRVAQERHYCLVPRKPAAR